MLSNTILRNLLLSLLLLPLIFFVSEGLVEAKTDTKKSISTNNTNKKWAVIDGFRSAKFGMDEKKVTRAIGKDFKISRSKIKRSVHPSQKTINLNINVPKLFAAGGDVRIVYIFGHRSKKLTQINVLWGSGVSKDVKSSDIVDAANLLRKHFIKKKYKDEGLAVNARIDDTQIIVFRGSDKKGRMAVLVLNTSKAKEEESKETLTDKASLALSYISDPTNPDVRTITIKEGDF
jgi:hypothetical protein